MPNESDFNKTFQEQLDDFRQKSPELSPDHWTDIWGDAHKRAFTVARVTEKDMLTDIQSALKTAIKNGESVEKFKKNLIPLLKEKGWLAPEGEAAEIVMPDGTVRKRLTGARLNLIYRQGLSQSYQTGRYIQMQENKENRPFWEYRISPKGSRNRPTHKAKNGHVYHADHEFWNVWWPPNGFNCGCYVVARAGDYPEKKKIVPKTDMPADMPDPGFDYVPDKALGGYAPVDPAEDLASALLAAEAVKAEAEADAVESLVEDMADIAEQAEEISFKGESIKDYHDKYYSDQTSKIVDKLTDEQLFALEQYGGNAYKAINDVLMGKKSSDDYLDGLISNLESIFDKESAKLDHDQLLFRGLNLPEILDSKNLKAGELIVHEGFVSTSFKQSVAEKFAKPIQGDIENSVIFRIHAKKDDCAIPFAAGETILGQTAGPEAEIIFNKMTSFRITGKHGEIIKDYGGGDGNEVKITIYDVDVVQ